MGRLRVQTWTGAVMLLAGLSLIGWYSWQTFGTTWVSERRHAEVVAQLEEVWREGSESADTEFGSASAIIRIPRFGSGYAVPLLHGTSDEVLAAGFGHVEGTSRAGEPGNFVIAGHRITHGEPLRDMPILDAGDEVVVETAAAIHTYRLTTGGDDLEVPFTASWVLDTKPVNPDPEGPQPEVAGSLITITTCSELFHTDDRLVAFGVLVDSATVSRTR